MLVRLANREATVSEPGQPADTRPPAVEGGEQHLATVEAYAEANPKSNRFL